MKFGSLVAGPFGTSVKNAGAAVYGAEAQLGLTNGVALVGNVAYTQPGLEIGAPVIGGVSVGQSSVLMYDAALRLRVPADGRASDLAVRAGRGRGGAPIVRRRSGLYTLDQCRVQRRRRGGRGSRAAGSAFN